MRTQILVAVCIIEDGKLLLLKQSKTSPQAGKWAPPAGHAESGEKPQEAALRELKEETGIYAKLVNIIESSLIDALQNGKHKDYLAVFYRAVRNSDDEIKTDGQENVEHVWADKNEIVQDKYPLRDAFMKPILLKAFGNNFAPLSTFNSYLLNLDRK